MQPCFPNFRNFFLNSAPVAKYEDNFINLSTQKQKEPPTIVEEPEKSNGMEGFRLPPFQIN
jgi:hypothetical protein